VSADETTVAGSPVGAPEQAAAPEPVWRDISPLDPDDLRCDRCDEVADAIHFVSSAGGYPREGDVHAVFSCPRHDAGGYDLLLVDWLDTGERHSTQDHVGRKLWGTEALGAFYDRVEEIRRAKA
jgi:hypothetical protein